MPPPRPALGTTRQLAHWGAIAAAITLALLALAGLLARWPVDDARLRDRTLAALTRTSGLEITASGPTTVRLLPRPTVELHGVTIRGADGAIAVEADSLRGRIDVLALLRGQFAIAGVSLRGPTAVLDVDRLVPMLSPLLSGQAPPAAFALLHTSGLTFEAGVVRLASADKTRDTLLTDISATLEWAADDAEASLSGMATWRGIAGEFHVDIDRPGRLIRGGQALASARLKSPALELDAEGTLLGGASDTRFVGKVASSTPDLPAFLSVIGMPIPQLSGLHQGRLGAAATLTRDALAFDAATLTLDDMTFDGALVISKRDDALALAGTLATDHMVLDPFLRAFPPMLTHGGRWSTAALDTAAIANDDIDLRISATSARWGPLRMEDGSLSLQSGRGRLELSLGEARAYDGLLKGRVVATLEGDTTDVRAEATVSRLDLKSMLKDLPGTYRATGTLTGRVVVEGRGSTPDTLVRSLDGQGQVNIHDGRIGGRLLAALFHATPSALLVPLPIAVNGGGLPFDAASFDAGIAGGTVGLREGWIAWPAERADIAGTISLPAQRFDLTAHVAAPDDPGGGDVYDLSGPWREMRMKARKPQPQR